MRMLYVSILGLATLVAGRTCKNVTVPVTISARTGIFDGLTLPITNLDATTFAQNMTQQGSNFTTTALTGYKTTSGTYNISTMLCQPSSSNYSSNSSTPVIQVLTHGIGFDKTYWDLSFNNYNYSYVEAATQAGYYTLSYDRLGIGNSSHGDPLNEIQTPLEIEALHALVMMLSNGSFPGMSHSFGKNIVAVGHSFGSVQSAALANAYPDLVSGLVLTGFSLNSTFMPSFIVGSNYMQANQNAPLRFGNVTGQEAMSVLFNSPLADYLSGIDLSMVPEPENLPAGYLVSGNIEANQLLFFHPNNFDPQILQLAESTKQPVTLGELLTLAGASSMMNAFAGPVMVIDGDGDLPFCGGDCMATGLPNVTSIAAASQMGFPMVNMANFTAYVQPKTGHGINLHYNATGAYQEILSFLKNKNLAPM